jgi:hypothetical protein
MRTRRRRGDALPVLAALSLAGIVAAACSDDDTSASGGATGGGGDDFVNDTRDAEPRAPANPNPGDGSVPTGEPDGYATGQPDAPLYGEGGASYGYDAPSSYPGVAECSSCSCPAATSYCFGGATPRGEPQTVTPSATGDAGTACPMVAAGTLGCTALPAGSTTCTALLQVLQPTYACYLDCAYDGKQMTVYCPNP